MRQDVVGRSHQDDPTRAERKGDPAATERGWQGSKFDPDRASPTFTFLDRIERDAERTFATTGESIAQRLDLTPGLQGDRGDHRCVLRGERTIFAPSMSFCSVKP